MKNVHWSGIELSSYFSTVNTECGLRTCVLVEGDHHVKCIVAQYAFPGPRLHICEVLCRPRCLQRAACIRKTLFLYRVGFRGCCLNTAKLFASSVAAFQPVIFDLLNVACCCLLLPTLRAIQSKGLQTKTAGRSVFPVELVGIRVVLQFPVRGPTVASCLLTALLSCWQWIVDR